MRGIRTRVRSIRHAYGLARQKIRKPRASLVHDEMVFNLAETSQTEHLPIERLRKLAAEISAAKFLLLLSNAIENMLVLFIENLVPSCV
jgi:hypothetical protein